MKKYFDIIYFNRKEIFIVLIMLIGFISFNIYNDSNVNSNVIEGIEVKEENLPDKIFIDIKGEVNSQGSYEIDHGKRIKDIIDLAGGLKESADTNNINLSEKLTDEMLIMIPKKQEQQVEPTIESNQVTFKDNKVSINVGSLTELMSISGIGKTKAHSIIDYRNKYGRFNSINDIMNVSGIGQATFEKIKDYIKV